MSGLVLFAVSHASVVDINQEPYRALARAGCTVRLVAPAALDTDVRGRIDFTPLAGFERSIKAVPLRSGGYSRRLGGQRGIHVVVYRGLGRLARAARPDLVYAEEEPFSFAALQASRIARRLRVPFVFHANQNVDKPLPPPFSTIRRTVFARASAATVRNAVAADLLRAHGFAGPVASWPHAVDPDRFAQPDVSLTEGLTRPVVGFVGRLVPEKGLDDLIDALARVGTGSLLVVGDGPERAVLERRARDAGVTARFVGALAHDRVPAVYGATDIIAIPSRTTSGWKEQFGRIVIEANAAGVAVIASDSGELPVTVASTGGGLTVPEGDPGALAGAIARLAGDAGERRSLGEKGRSGVLAHFTPEAVASRLLMFFERIVEES